MKPITVHMVGNAHLDPVWLWPWQSGADEAIATCRSACDLLDEFPQAVFTRGEAWVYEQLRTQDPALFQRPPWVWDDYQGESRVRMFE